MGKIIIYYLSYCPHSMEAIRTLRSISNIELKEKLSDNNKEEIKSKNIKKYNHHTFPLILYQSEETGKKYYIGGNDKLQEIIREVNIKSKISTEEIPKCITSYYNRTEGEQRFICYLLVKKNYIL